MNVVAGIAGGDEELSIPNLVAIQQDQIEFRQVVLSLKPLGEDVLAGPRFVGQLGAAEEAGVKLSETHDRNLISPDRALLGTGGLGDARRSRFRLDLTAGNTRD